MKTLARRDDWIHRENVIIGTLQSCRVGSVEPHIAEETNEVEPEDRWVSFALRVRVQGSQSVGKSEHTRKIGVRREESDECKLLLGFHVHAASGLLVWCLWRKLGGG
jgi:hypothetical protein